MPHLSGQARELQQMYWIYYKTCSSTKNLVPVLEVVINYDCDEWEIFKKTLYFVYIFSNSFEFLPTQKEFSVLPYFDRKGC